MMRPEEDPIPLSIALIGICGAAQIARALDGLARQEGVPEPEVVVTYDPRLPGVGALAERYPRVRFISHRDESTPIRMVGRAIAESRGDVVLLTEDHCVAEPGWAKALYDALTQEACGAAGGPIEVRRPASPTDWAFYFVDFYRYARPVKVATTGALSVCNVGYRRKDLEALELDWRTMFVDALVHDALKAQGPLRLVDAAGVSVLRHVRLYDALRERYVFGRVFGSNRIQGAPMKSRWTLRLGAPLLPAMILRRMVEKGLESDELKQDMLRGAGPLALMVLAWAAGETLGYWTGTHPEDLSVAPEAI
jgi:hypothetical protein